MNPKLIKEVVKHHEKWLNGETIYRINFRGQDLRKADFRGMDLRGMDFQKADLRGADFRSADIRGADFEDAKMEGVKYDNLAPSEKFTAWKMVCGGVVIELEVPADADRINPLGTDAVRVSKALVIGDSTETERWLSANFGQADASNDFWYIRGQMAVADGFDSNIGNYYGQGISCFLKKEQADGYMVW